MLLCNPKGFSMFIPLQPENILIELPTLLVCISLTSAPGLGFCCVPAHWSICFSPTFRLSQAHPHNIRGVWPMGTTWPHWSISPSPLSPSPGQLGAGWRAREIFLRLHQVVPGSRLSRGCWEVLHRWGFPSCSLYPAFSFQDPGAFPTGACPWSNPKELLSLCLWGPGCPQLPPPRPLLMELLGTALSLVICALPGGLVLLENPAKGLSPCHGERVRWRQMVESHMLREEER